MLDLSHVNALITPLPPIATPRKATGTRRLTGSVGRSPALQTPQTPQQPQQSVDGSAVQVGYMQHAAMHMPPCHHPTVGHCTVPHYDIVYGARCN